MNSLPIGSTVAALDECGHWVECVIVHLCDVEDTPHAVLLPRDGDYSFVRPLAALRGSEADSPLVAEEATAA